MLSLHYTRLDDNRVNCSFKSHTYTCEFKVKAATISNRINTPVKEYSGFLIKVANIDINLIFYFKINDLIQQSVVNLEYKTNIKQ